MINGHPLYYLTPPYENATPIAQARQYLEDVATKRGDFVLRHSIDSIRLTIGPSEFLFTVRPQSGESHSTIDVKLKLDVKYSTLASITFFWNNSFKQPLPRVVVKTPTDKSAGLLELMGTRNHSVMRSDLVDRAKTV